MTTSANLPIADGKQIGVYTDDGKFISFNGLTDLTGADALGLVADAPDARSLLGRLLTIVTRLGGLLTVDTVVKAVAVDRGALVGVAASQLMAANTSRRGFSIQNQSSTAPIYINGTAGATTDYHSFLIPPLGYFETPAGHVGTGAISIISTVANTSVYAREW